MEYRKELVQIPVEDNASPNRTLLGLIVSTSTESNQAPFKNHTHVYIYLHGFPDLSVDPCLSLNDELPEGSLDFASRFARKLCTSAMQLKEENHHVLFVGFNFSGVPGSDKQIPFHEKTISKEVQDAKSVIGFVKSRYLAESGYIHVIGLSTGAIVASLLRGEYLLNRNMTFTSIAGLLDLAKGIEYDFDEVQRKDFEERGKCWKEFYLPASYPTSCLSQASVKLDQSYVSDNTIKVFIELDRNYIDECTNGSLSIQKSVAAAGGPPLLVLHGEADRNVPFNSGLELFNAAAEPKAFLAIRKGNHLLSNSNHFKKAWKAILQHTNIK